MDTYFTLSGTQSAILTLVVVGVMFLLFLREVFPTEVVAMIGVSILLVSGVLSYDDAVAAFARHHLTLAAPRRVLLLGDFASRLLLEAPMLESRGSLRYINHNGADMAAINCFHPRTLLARPGFKKQAWQDLQILMKELGR